MRIAITALIILALGCGKKAAEKAEVPSRLGYDVVLSEHIRFQVDGIEFTADTPNGFCVFPPLSSAKKNERSQAGLDKDELEVGNINLNDVQAVLVEIDEMNLFRTGEPPPFNRFVTIVRLRVPEGEEVTPEYFEAFKKSGIGELKSDMGNARTADELISGRGTGISESVLLTSKDCSPTCFVVVSKAMPAPQAQNAMQPETVKINAFAARLVNGKILMIEAICFGDSEENIAWASNTAETLALSLR